MTTMTYQTLDEETQTKFAEMLEKAEYEVVFGENSGEKTVEEARREMVLELMAKVYRMPRKAAPIVGQARDLPPELIERIRSLWDDGVDIFAIAAEVNVPVSQIQRYVRKK